MFVSSKGTAGTCECGNQQGTACGGSQYLSHITTVWTFIYSLEERVLDLACFCYVIIYADQDVAVGFLLLLWACDVWGIRAESDF